MMIALMWLACAPPEPEPEGSPSNGTFDALTYNVHGLPDTITGDDGEARMRAIAPLLPAYDLIGVQETFDEGKHALLTADADHDIQLWSGEILDSTRAYGNGLALLARGMPYVDDTAVFYTTCNGLVDGSSDCLASKGFQVLRVDLGGAELDIYNTHHEAGGGDDDNAARAVQVQQVIDHMNGFSAGRAILFMGDTNLRPSDPPDAEQLAVYAAAGLRDACVEIDCAESDEIDRFFLRDSSDLSLTVEEWSNEPAFFDAEGVPLSDHPAIHVSLGWSVGR